MKRLRRVSLHAGLLASLILAPAPSLFGEEGKVRPKQRLAELLESKEKAQGPAPPGSTGRNEPSSRLGLWAAGVLACAAGWIVLRKARRRGAGISMRAGVAAAEEIEVVARLPLTHKHAVYVVNACGRRFALGISAEGITLLGALGGEASAHVPPDALPSARAASAHGYSALPEGKEAVSSARLLRDADLAPYRKQMDRIRGLLRGMRGDLMADDAAGEEPSP